MRISDWSSDVCSSDLQNLQPRPDSKGDLLADLERRERLALPRQLLRHPPVRPVAELGDEIRRPSREGPSRFGHVDAHHVGTDRERAVGPAVEQDVGQGDRKSTRSELQSLMRISYAVFCLQKK